MYDTDQWHPGFFDQDRIEDVGSRHQLPTEVRHQLPPGAIVIESDRPLSDAAVERLLDSQRPVFTKLANGMFYQVVYPSHEGLAMFLEKQREQGPQRFEKDGEPIKYEPGEFDESRHPRETTEHDGKRPGEFAPSYAVKPPKKLYRGTKGGEGIGTYALGKGVYSSPDKSFAAMYGEVEELSPEEAWPRNPLVIHNAAGGGPQAFTDWILQNTNFRNIREFNKAYKDPGDFVREQGYDGVIVGDEVVWYGEPEQYSKDETQKGMFGEDYKPGTYTDADSDINPVQKTTVEKAKESQFNLFDKQADPDQKKFFAKKYEKRQAPAGGVTVGGVFYEGGKFIPDEAWEAAGQQEQQAFHEAEPHQFRSASEWPEGVHIVLPRDKTESVWESQGKGMFRNTSTGEEMHMDDMPGGMFNTHPMDFFSAANKALNKSMIDTHEQHQRQWRDDTGQVQPEHDPANYEPHVQAVHQALSEGGDLRSIDNVHEYDAGAAEAVWRRGYKSPKDIKAALSTSAMHRNHYQGQAKEMSQEGMQKYVTAVQGQLDKRWPKKDDGVAGVDPDSIGRDSPGTPGTQGEAGQGDDAAVRDAQGDGAGAPVVRGDVYGELQETFADRDDKFWGVNTGEEGESTFDGLNISGVQCTGFACRIHSKMPDRAKIYGYDHADNPTQLTEEAAADGHDFAVVDDQYIVDPWASELEGLHDKTVLDMKDPDDAETIKSMYGDPAKWSHMPEMEEKARRGAGDSPKPLNANPKYADTSPHTELKATDLVQWNNQGEDQFMYARQLEGFSEDGKYGFIKGSSTGIPVDQLKATHGGVEQPKPQGDWMGPQGVQNLDNMRPGDTVGDWVKGQTKDGVGWFQNNAGDVKLSSDLHEVLPKEDYEAKFGPKDAPPGSRSKVASDEELKIMDVASKFGSSYVTAQSAKNFALLAAHQLGHTPEGSTDDERATNAAQHLEQQLPRMDSLIGAAEKMGIKSNNKSKIIAAKHAADGLIDTAVKAGWQPDAPLEEIHDAIVKGDSDAGDMYRQQIGKALEHLGQDPGYKSLYSQLSEAVGGEKNLWILAGVIAAMWFAHSAISGR